MRTYYAEDLRNVVTHMPEKDKDKDKGFYFSIHVTAGHGNDDTTHVFMAESPADREAWMNNVREIMVTKQESKKKNLGDDVVVETKNEFVTIECFVKSGVRVNGVVEPDVLSALGGGDVKHKKIHDDRGWFCDR